MREQQHSNDPNEDDYGEEAKDIEEEEGNNRDYNLSCIKSHYSYPGNFVTGKQYLVKLGSGGVDH